MPPVGGSIPAWQRIVGNFIINGPSGNRDLGNLFPTVDNDDGEGGQLPFASLCGLQVCCTPNAGSAYYWIAENVVYAGGFKNYLGHDKVG